MRIDKIIFKDFLTYKDFEYAFQNKPLLIQGLNLTDDNQKTNGTGKSGIQTGIEYCITASNSRDVRDNELVTYGKKEARIQMFASCDHRKETIHIDWTIKISGSNVLKLKIKKYGEEWAEEEIDGTNRNSVKFSNVNDGKKFIIEWFAISKEDLFNYYIINKTRFKSFFKSSNTEKIALVNRFSDASIMEGAEEIDKSELESLLATTEKKVSECEGKIDLLGEQISKEMNRNFEAEIAEEKSDLLEEIESIKGSIELVKDQIIAKKNKIKLINDVDIVNSKENVKTAVLDQKDIDKEIEESELVIKKINEELVEAEKLVSEFKSTDWSAEKSVFLDKIKDKNDSLEIIRAKKDKFNTQETQLLKFIQKIEVILGGTIKCPACSHEFLLDENVNIDTEKQKMKEAEGMKISLEKAKKLNENGMADLRNSISDLEVGVSAINKMEELENQAKNLLVRGVNEINVKFNTAKSKSNRLDQELRTCKSDISTYEKEIENFKLAIKNIEAAIKNHETEIVNFNAEIAGYENEIKLLKADNNKGLIKSLKENKSALEATILIHRKELASIGDEIYEINQWSNNFKQFRMFLANKSINIIEYHCNRYLIDMGSDLRVKMEGFKVLASGKIKEEINAIIIREFERSFSSFSGGEQGRLLFAAILANRHLINETHPYGGLDFLCIDEVFEGVDSMGLKLLIKSAKTLEIPVMIITHVSDEEVSSDKITIVKEKGYSRIQ